MKERNQYAQDEFETEVVALLGQVQRTVYQKEFVQRMAAAAARRAWEETTMTPVRYVQFVADPHNIGNRGGKGQAELKRRWKDWLRTKGIHTD